MVPMTPRKDIKLWCFSTSRSVFVGHVHELMGGEATRSSQQCCAGDKSREVISVSNWLPYPLSRVPLG